MRQESGKETSWSMRMPSASIPRTSEEEAMKRRMPFSGRLLRVLGAIGLLSVASILPASATAATGEGRAEPRFHGLCLPDARHGRGGDHSNADLCRDEQHAGRAGGRGDQPAHVAERVGFPGAVDGRHPSRRGTGPDADLPHYPRQPGGRVRADPLRDQRTRNFSRYGQLHRRWSARPLRRSEEGARPE
jgi:hypothetical protein